MNSFLGLKCLLNQFQFFFISLMAVGLEKVNREVLFYAERVHLSFRTMKKSKRKDER